MRVVSFSLNMRPGDLAKDEPKITVPADRLLKPASEPPAYTSLLGTKPWQAPTSPSSTGLPPIPRLATPGTKDFRITPDTLRFLSAKVEEIATRIHGVEAAYQHANARVALQCEELQRQAAKVAEIRTLLGELRGARQDRIGARARAVQDGQQVLLERLDRVRGELMKRANPTLSDHETKWFGELGRMRQQVLGAGRYDEASLIARVQAVRTFSLSVFNSNGLDDVVFSPHTAEKGARPTAAALESAERKGAGAGENHAGKESGPWPISSVRVRTTVQQGVSFFLCFLSYFASELWEIFLGARSWKSCKLIYLTSPPV